MIKRTPEEVRVDKVRRAHEKRYPDGCGETWEVMAFRVNYGSGCPDCVTRLAAQLPISPEVQAWRRLSWIRESLVRDVSAGDAKVVRFREDLEKNAGSALIWSREVFDAVAKRDVAVAILEMLDHPQGGLDYAIRRATEKALQGARSPARSTSPTSNIMEEAVTAAWATWLQSAGRLA